MTVTQQRKKIECLIAAAKEEDYGDRKIKKALKGNGCGRPDCTGKDCEDLALHKLTDAWIELRVLEEKEHQKAIGK